MATVDFNEIREADVTRRLALLLQHQDRFLPFLERRLGSRAEAEDVLQIAYVKVLTEVETVREDTKLVPWFYRLLRNMLVDQHRRRGATARLQERLSHEPPVATAPDDGLPRTVCQCVIDLAQTLKPEYCEVLRRVVLEEESLEQVAATLGITPNNASVRLHRARRTLRTVLGHRCGPCVEEGCLDCTCR